MQNKNFIFRKENEELFIRYWNDYMATHAVGPHYLLRQIDYFLTYSSSIRADRSFVMLQDNKPIACVFLPIEETPLGRSISLGQDFVSAPIFEKHDGTEARIFNEIDRIATEEKVEKIMFSIEPLLYEQYSYNFLLNHQYLNASLLSYLVDCQHISMRRNHERSIKKILGDKVFSIYIMDMNNADRQIHEYYCLLHHKCAGKITRNKETFDLQYAMLEQGNAVLIGLKFNNTFIAFTYFTFYQFGADSFSAADDPEYNHLPLYHCINFEAMQYLKKKGVQWIDMGQPLTVSHELFYYPDAKQMNIAHFKLGFGGEFKMNFRGVKYLSKSTFQKDMEGFTKAYEPIIFH